jgi:DNA-binding LacI/PurR family transcriptional regulator
MSARQELKIRDVARLAGVSPATVSRVLRGSAPVSHETRTRVMAVVGRFDYQPSHLARHLRRGRTDLVGMVVSDIENPYFATLVREMEYHVYQRGARVLLCNTSEDAAKQSAYLTVMAGERVSGVVLSPSDPGDPQISRLLDIGIPIVAIDRRVTDPRADSVVAENRQAARRATELLIEGGRKRIAFIGGRTEVDTGSDRLAGYREAMAAAQLVPRVTRGDFTTAGAHRAMEALWDADPDIDGLLVANNQMTIGALEVLRGVGAELPSQVALIGFDDPPWARLMDPPLAGIAHPLPRMAAAAVDLLFDHLSAAPLHRPTHLTFPLELRIRRSCGRQ